MKTQINHSTVLMGIVLSALLLVSCHKEFLDAKPDKSILIPGTLNDFQAILDNTAVMNISPELGLIASDDLYITTDGLSSLNTQTEKNSYIWAANVYEGENVQDWNTPYQQVFYSNVVLDGLKGSAGAGTTAFNNVKGSALFFRGLAFYNLSQVFVAPYDSVKAVSLPGIPIRTTSEVNTKSVRGTLKETYDQLISDISSSIALLPVNVSFKSRPNKAAAYALLARVYLSMEKYGKAGLYADSSLQLNSKLNNYSNYSATDYRPFPLVLPNANDEVDFDMSPLPYSFDESPFTFVDTVLYKSYDNADYRKTLFFTDQGNGGYNFQGSYAGNYILFSGLATDEMYLIRAEAEARSGNISAAMNDINTLLVTRHVSGQFQPYSALTSTEALSIVLAERRKELVTRTLRWSDLRRLNKDPRFATVLTRNINDQTYTLQPGDNKYVFPIPDEETRGSGIPQNPR